MATRVILSRSGRRSIGRWFRRLAAACALSALAPMAVGYAVEIGGPFALVDHDGHARTEQDFRGSYLLVYFGYTYCPDLCPTSLQEMADALDLLARESPAKAERVVPLFISVDPERDSAQVLSDYVSAFHPRMVGLTGTPRALTQLGRKYGAYFASVPGTTAGDYLMEHTSFIYLMGPDGKYLEHFEKDASVDDLVAALRRQVVAPDGQGS